MSFHQLHLPNTSGICVSSRRTVFQPSTVPQASSIARAYSGVGGNHVLIDSTLYIISRTLLWLLGTANYLGGGSALRYVIISVHHQCLSHVRDSDLPPVSLLCVLKTLLK